ncbi:hypothetical protein GGR54DRAFT_617297 [Hypoxylon sp. NC1633]|nr:hypothetical protein GGR54DRAFT_617297 [Hypoxylon sp. NC1633]
MRWYCGAACYTWSLLCPACFASSHKLRKTRDGATCQRSNACMYVGNPFSSMSSTSDILHRPIQPGSSSPASALMTRHNYLDIGNQDISFILLRSDQISS